MVEQRRKRPDAKPQPTMPTREAILRRIVECEHKLQESRKELLEREQAISSLRLVSRSMSQLQRQLAEWSTILYNIQKEKPDFLTRAFSPDKATKWNARKAQAERRLHAVNENIKALLRHNKVYPSYSGTAEEAVNAEIRRLENSLRSDVLPLVARLETALANAKQRLTDFDARQELEAMRLEKKRIGDEAKAAREAKKAQAERMAKARLAAADKRSRELASFTKRELARYDRCPYCNELMGNAPHADHIYPLSLGGLSIRENMVLVCGSCNVKKSVMTLREFIEAEQLDRTRIEYTLKQLGKKY